MERGVPTPSIADMGRLPAPDSTSAGNGASTFPVALGFR
jgi:hypothetical protein